MAKRGARSSSSGRVVVVAGLAVLCLAGALFGVNALRSGGSNGSGSATAGEPGATPSFPTSTETSPAASPETSPQTFSITGSVTQLVPGASRTVLLTLTNNGSRSLRVKKLSAHATGESGCPASYLGLGADYSSGQGSTSPRNVLIPAGAAVSTPFPVMLFVTAPNSCKNVTWTLSYSGSAEHA
jgi:hypothetical protein